jgi:hypothetical protein
VSSVSHVQAECALYLPRDAYQKFLCTQEDSQRHGVMSLLHTCPHPRGLQLLLYHIPQEGALVKSHLWEWEWGGGVELQHLKATLKKGT